MNAVLVALSYEDLFLTGGLCLCGVSNFDEESVQIHILGRNDRSFQV